MKVYHWVLGSIILCRNWVRYKEWRRRHQTQQQLNTLNSQDDTEVTAAEESGEVADGELCVVCLMRRRRSAFVPCGHLVCCQRCALSVEREASPKCPVCRQPIRNSVRIYDSWVAIISTIEMILLYIKSNWVVMMRERRKNKFCKCQCIRRIVSLARSQQHRD